MALLLRFVGNMAFAAMVLLMFWWLTTGVSAIVQDGRSSGGGSRQPPPTLQQRRSAPSAEHEWMLSARDTRQTVDAALRAHYGGWSAHDIVERSWKRLQKAQTAEALAHYSSVRRDNHTAMEALRPSETYDEFARSAGLLDSAEVQDVVAAFEHCFDRTDWNGLIEYLLTDDVVISELGAGGAVCRGRDEAEQCLQQWSDERMANCARMRCERATYISDTIASRAGPVLVQRVIETLHGHGFYNHGHSSSSSSSDADTSDDRAALQVVARTLHVFFFILRPPHSISSHDDRAAPLSHSRIAVLEHLQVPLSDAYEAPLELAHQVRDLLQRVETHERQWHRLHRDAVQEQHDYFVTQHGYGHYVHEIAALRRKLEHWCQRRRELGEDVGQVDCGWFAFQAFAARGDSSSSSSGGGGGGGTSKTPTAQHYRRRNGRGGIKRDDVSAE